MFKPVSNLLVGMMAIVAVGCSTGHNPESKEMATKAEIGNIVSDFWVSDPNTKLESADVLIILHGGPRNFLYFVKDGRTLARYLPGYKNQHVIYLHQAQTLNPELFSIGKDFSIERARLEKATTTDMLHKAITHFKSAGKSVTVMGHSYGAFIATDYMANYDMQADRYILTAGRVAVPLDMVADNMRGLSSKFKEDAVTYIPVTQIDLSDRTSDEKNAYHVRALLKAAYGEPRYMEKLKNKGLENVTFITGKSDQQVGSLTSEETAFLENRGAKVVYVEGGHYDVFKRMIDGVMANEIEF